MRIEPSSCSAHFTCACACAVRALGHWGQAAEGRSHKKRVFWFTGRCVGWRKGSAFSWLWPNMTNGVLALTRRPQDGMQGATIGLGRHFDERAGGLAG